MSIPKYDELMKPLLSIIQDGQIYKIKDLYTPLAEHYHLTDEELSQLGIQESGGLGKYISQQSWTCE